jgi:predicted branched-subunit amino acid permease/uncharacterized membrane protein
MIAFGLAVGATAARKGFSFLESLFMNLFVYAGMSQLVAMEVWPERVTIAALGALMFLCIVINARMLLITASLQPWLGALPPWKIYPALHIVVDPGWLIAMRYRAEGGSDIGVFFGSSVMLAIAWMSATTAGHLAGALITDPRRFGIDLVMPVFFAAMLIPLWRGPRRAAAWLVRARLPPRPAALRRLVVHRRVPLPAASRKNPSMTPSDAGEWGVAAAIAAMAVATYAMRAGGFWLMGKVQPSARLRRMLDALPGSVVAATVLPIIAREGLVAVVAIAAAGTMMLVRRNDLLAVVTGMAVAAMARAAGL